MSNVSLYDKNTQIDLQYITITKPGAQPVDITQVMEQFIIYEDMFQTATSARLIIRDQVNLVGTLPIVSGEAIQIKFKTPIYDKYLTLDFIVYQVGERDFGLGSDNIQFNQLFLCTPEVWWAANNDSSSAHKGTYASIIESILKETGTKKDFINKEESVGLVEYVAPNWNPFQCIKFCAARANSKTSSPMFFWESTNGYNLKSLKELYRAAYDKIIYIEDRNIFGANSDGEKVFNTVYSFDYLASNNRLEQYTNNAFGVDYVSLDFTNKRMIHTSNSYDQVFHSQDIKLNKFPLNDDAKLIRNKDVYSPYRSDLSHLSQFTKDSTISLMDNVRLMVNIPGDSNLRSGNVIWLDIPSKAALTIGSEEHTSGKWLTRSIKHLITKNTYSMICEITKDSFDSNVRAQS